MADIFISYLRTDAQIAEWLLKAFEKIGWTVWLDRYMHAGAEVRKTITRELDSARCVVVVWSSRAEEAHWVINEAERARDRGVLVPATLDGSRPVDFGHLNFANLRDWDGDEEHTGFKQLIAGVQQMLASALRPEGAVGTATSSPEPRSSRPGPRPSRASPAVSGVATAVRSIVETTSGWQASTLQQLILAFGQGGRQEARAALLECVTPKRELSQLGALYCALKWLDPDLDREEFFSACGRWPPPRLSTRFVHVPDGSYQIGSPPDEAGRHPDEHQQTLRLTGFWIAETPVTNRDFLLLSARHPFREWKGLTRAELETHPVVRTTWGEANLFCAWVGGRLPTEAEWESACRAGTKTPYTFGHTLGAELANFTHPGGGALRRTTPVGASGRPNGFGLFDMHGNVWEWCADYYQADFFSQERGKDPVCDQEGPYKVVRGGSWDAPAQGCRAAFRNRLQPDHRFDNVGFRVVVG
jgi:sulfatase modifying factor 1